MLLIKTQITTSLGKIWSGANEKAEEQSPTAAAALLQPTFSMDFWHFECFSFHLVSYSVREVLVLVPFHKWGNGGLEGLLLLHCSVLTRFFSHLALSLHYLVILSFYIFMTCHDSSTFLKADGLCVSCILSLWLEQERNSVNISCLTSYN